MYDKQIHRDDFRLRLLVTNACNRNCEYCLNDFQKKPYPALFLNPFMAKNMIEEYCKFAKAMNITPKVEFSGGEPGIYPYLSDLLFVAKASGAWTKVNTNGAAWGSLEKFDKRKWVDCWPVSINSIKLGSLLVNAMKYYGANVSVQYVVTHSRINQVANLIYAFDSTIPIKLFVDFHEDGQRKKDIEHIIEQFSNYSNVSTRFTGIQENRGPLCKDCQVKCVTLKGIWVFPNNTFSLCPQGQAPIFDGNKTGFNSLMLSSFYHQHKPVG